jgi:hypothetical protein
MPVKKTGKLLIFVRKSPFQMGRDIYAINCVVPAIQEGPQRNGYNLFHFPIRAEALLAADPANHGMDDPAEKNQAL